LETKGLVGLPGLEPGTERL